MPKNNYVSILPVGVKGTPTVKILAVPQCIQELAYEPAIPFLDIDPKGLKTAVQTHICTKIFVVLLSITCKNKQPRHPQNC